MIEAIITGAGLAGWLGCTFLIGYLAFWMGCAHQHGIDKAFVERVYGKGARR